MSDETQAERVKSQVTTAWTYDGVCMINAQDVIRDLKYDVVGLEDSKESHMGFDSSEDGSMVVFFYSDNSALAISSAGMTSIG